MKDARWMTRSAKGRPVAVACAALGAFLVGCGKSESRAPGAAEAMVTVTDANFEQEVIKSDVPVLVDFWASWCGPCLTLAPTIDEIAVAYKGRVKVCKYEIAGANRKQAESYRIDQIPHVILFKNGEPVAHFLGIQPRERYQSVIDKTLPNAGVTSDNR